MEFTLSVRMDNAAFEDPDELPRILRRVAIQTAQTQHNDWGYVLDINGNRVGGWSIKESE